MKGCFDVKGEVKGKIDWVANAHSNPGHYNSDKDISVRRIHTNGKKSGNGGYQFTFRNNVGSKFGQYLQTGLLGSRIYFKNSAMSDGFKVSTQERSNNRIHGYMRVPRKDKTEVYDDFVGDYDLLYDPVVELYYIQKEDKE